MEQANTRCVDHRGGDFRNRRRVPHPREEPWAVLHSAGAAGTHRRNLGPESLSGNPLRQRHLHAQLPWEPWTRPENVADGGDIREYLTEAARKHGIDEHIRFSTRVISADWDSTTDTWTVQTESDGRIEGLPGPLPVLRQRLLQLRRAVPARLPRPRRVHRRRGASPVLAGVAGLHRQGSRRDRQRRNSRQHDPVVVGDGWARDDAAALAVLHHVDAAHPSRGPGDPEGAAARRSGNSAVRLYNTLFTVLVYGVARTAPRFSRWLVRSGAKRALPEGYPVDVHFKPRYNPWDQRLCADARQRLSTRRSATVVSRW